MFSDCGWHLPYSSALLYMSKALRITAEWKPSLSQIHWPHDGHWSLKLEALSIVGTTDEWQVNTPWHHSAPSLQAGWHLRLFFSLWIKLVNANGIQIIDNTSQEFLWVNLNSTFLLIMTRAQGRPDETVKWEMNDVGLDYKTVAIIGSQSSGKSDSIFGPAIMHDIFYSQVLFWTMFSEQILPSWIPWYAIEQRLASIFKYVTVYNLWQRSRCVAIAW